MPVFPALLKPVRLLWMIVLATTVCTWSAEATLHREAWFGFDGQKMTFADRLTFAVDHPMRLSLVEPYRLDAAHPGGESQSGCSNGPWIPLFKSPSGDTGFAVAGEGEVQILSTVDAPLWRSIPISPMGWNLDTATLDVHLGPGWSLLAVTGPGRLEGGWMSTWTWKSFLLVAVLTGLAAWGVSWRMGVCAAIAGLAIGGMGVVLPGMFAVLVVFIAIGIRLPQQDWKAQTVFELASMLAAVVGLWLSFHSLWEFNQAIQPQSATVQENSHGKWNEMLLHKGWYSHSEQECTGSESRMRVESSAGEPRWSNEVRTGFDVESAWLPDKDSFAFLLAPSGPEVPFWHFTMGHVEWPSAARGQNRVAVEAEDRMRILAAPPWLTALARIAGVSALWALWIGLCLRHGHFHRRWRRWSSLAPKLALLAVICAPVASRASQTDSVEGEIVRTFSFDGRWSLSTSIVQDRGLQKTFRIPLMEAEDPIDSLRIQEGQVLVSRGRDKFRRDRGPGGMFDDAIADEEDPWKQNMLDIILSGEKPPEPDFESRPSKPSAPDSVIKESYRSGTWAAPSDWRGHLPARESWMPAGGVLKVSAPQHPRWLETWVVRCSPRFQPVFHGLQPGGEADAKASFVFHPRPGDSLRVETVRLESVPVAALEIAHATLRYSDANFTGGRLWLHLRVSASDTLRVGLAPHASELEVFVNGMETDVRRGSDGVVAVPIAGAMGQATVALTWKTPGQRGIFRRAEPLRVSARGANLFVELPELEDVWVLGLGARGAGPHVVWWIVPLLALAVVWRLSRSRRLVGGPFAWWVALGAWPSLLVSWDLLRIFPFGLTMELGRAVDRIENGVLDPLMNLYQVLSPMEPEWYLDRFDGLLSRPWMIVVPKFVCFVVCLLWYWAIRRILAADRKSGRVS